MSKWVVRFGVMVMVASIAFSAVGFAAAQGPDSQGGGRKNGPATGDRPGQNGTGEQVIQSLLNAAADAAGMTAQELVTAVRDADGQTLSDILIANGADPQAVSDAVKAEVTEVINTAVAEGTLTEEQAQTALSNLDTVLANAMNSDLPLQATPLRDAVRDRTGDIVENSLLGVLAEMAGEDVQDIVRDAITPPTLVEIAASYELDADAIIAETEARVTAEVTQKIADGTLTQEQGDAILDGLHDRLVDRFNSPLGQGVKGERPGGGGRFSGQNQGEQPSSGV